MATLRPLCAKTVSRGTEGEAGGDDDDDDESDPGPILDAFRKDGFR